MTIDKNGCGLKPLLLIASLGCMRRQLSFQELYTEGSSYYTINHAAVIEKFQVIACHFSATAGDYVQPVAM